MFNNGLLYNILVYSLIPWSYKREERVWYTSLVSYMYLHGNTSQGHRLIGNTGNVRTKTTDVRVQRYKKIRICVLRKRIHVHVNVGVDRGWVRL